MGLDATRAAQIQDAVHGVTTLAATVTPLNVRLMTANGSATANGTELSTGGSYVAGTGLSPATFGAATVANPSSASNSVVISQTNMPAGTTIGIEIWDSAGTPKRQTLGTLTVSRTTVAGDTLSFAGASIVETLI